MFLFCLLLSLSFNGLTFTQLPRAREHQETENSAREVTCLQFLINTNNSCFPSAHSLARQINLRSLHFFLAFCKWKPTLRPPLRRACPSATGQLQLRVSVQWPNTSRHYEIRLWEQGSGSGLAPRKAHGSAAVTRDLAASLCALWFYSFTMENDDAHVDFCWEFMNEACSANPQ